MAAGVGGVLTTLLIILIFLQLRSVLYYQKLDDGVIMTFGTNYPSHTSKISCFGKDILQYLISNAGNNKITELRAILQRESQNS
jgi:hypothetical protein